MTKENRSSLSTAQWAAIGTIVTAILGLCGVFATSLLTGCFGHPDLCGLAPPPSPTAAIPQNTFQPIMPPTGGGETETLTAMANLPGQENSQTASALTLAAQNSYATQTADALTAISQGDTDRDGLANGYEQQIGTDPANADTDGDGLNDGQEVSKGTNPLNPDSDGDGLNDYQEVSVGTDPLKSDTDQDGLSDKQEISFGTNPNSSDSDGDGLTDAKEISYGTNPVKSDTDGDGLTDGKEISLSTDPNNPDSDGDTLSDGREVSIGTNPNKKDTDGDGMADNVDPDPLVALAICQTKTVTVPAHSTVTYIPPKTRGDGDFSGHGPDVNVTVQFRPLNIPLKSGSDLFFRVEISMTAKETVSDFTTASGTLILDSSNEYVLDVPAGYVFNDFITPIKNSCIYRDTDHAVDTVYPTSSGPIKYCKITGDTSGNEAGTETKAVVYFNAMKFKVKQVDNCR